MCEKKASFLIAASHHEVASHRLMALMLCFVSSLLLFSSLAMAASGGGKIVTVNVAGDGHALSPDFFGFNEGLDRGNFSFADPEYVQQLTELAPQAMRFPGGTNANFFHWKTGRINPDEFDHVPGKWVRDNMSSNYKQLSETEGSLSFDDFMHACMKSGSRAYIVLNLYTGSPEESAAWARYAKSKGYKIAGWELGNELYMTAYKDKVPDVQSYIRLAKRHIDAIRKVDPDARFGVVAAPDALTGSPKTRAFNDAWNRVIAQEGFYDGYVVHNYFGFPRKGRMQQEDLVDYTLSMANETTEKHMQYYLDLFGSKPIWMTEWNWFGYRFKQANDTHLNALFIGDMLIQLLSYPEIKTAMYHQLASSGRWPALFFDAKFLLEHEAREKESEYSLPESCNGKKRCVLRNSVFYPFWLFSQAVRGADQVFPLKLSANVLRHYQIQFKKRDYDLEYPLLRVIGLGNSGQVQHVLVSNVGDQPVEMDFAGALSADGWGNGSKQASMQCISRPDMMDREDDAKSPEQNMVSKHVRSVSVQGTRAKVPSYSFCVADF